MGRFENKEIVRRYIEQVVNTGNLDAMQEFVAQDYIDHNAPSGSSPGIEEAKRFLEAVHHVYGDFHVAIEDQIAEGDTVVTRVSATG